VISLFRLVKALSRHGFSRQPLQVKVISNDVCAVFPGEVTRPEAAALPGFTRSMAREVGSRNITVNAVAPGFIETDMTHALSEEQRKALEGQIPLERLGTPEDIAGTVVFLCSRAGAYITGEVLNVNGGMYMG
jgi:3-oxoacyl-[acyl-carrier protein] reductase